MTAKVVAIIQARMGSKRLPGKSLADLAGKPLLWQVLERVKRSKQIDELVLATTTKPEDDVLVDIAKGCGISVFRGSENDLVDRYYQAARAHHAGIVVRICADNPVLEPEEIDRIIEYHKLGGNDFSSNTHNINDNEYPDGLGAEVFDFEKLEELWKITTDPRNREHPHTYFYEHPEKYRIGTIPCPQAFRRPELKLDVNTPGELAYIRAIYEYWYPKKPDFHITDVIWWHDHVRVCPVDTKHQEQTPALGRRFAWGPNRHPKLSPSALAAKASVERKIADGTYGFEERPCFCGSEDSLLLSTRDYYGFYYPFVACKQCGLLRANPRMTEKSYAMFYDQEYRASYGEDDNQLECYFESSLSQGKGVYERVTGWLGSSSTPKVVFEIGCNMGAMLVPWKDVGCEVHGADFNRRRIEEGKKRAGIPNLYVGGVEQLGKTGRKADLIILHHVFEHFLELDHILTQIRELMHPRAQVYIALPGTMLWIKQHCGGDIMSLLQNAHTYQFSLTTLRYVMECSGFEFVQGNEEIEALFQRSDRTRNRSDVPVWEYDKIIKHLRRTESAYTPKRYLKYWAEVFGVKETLKKIVRRKNQHAQ